MDKQLAQAFAEMELTRNSRAVGRGRGLNKINPDQGPIQNEIGNAAGTAIGGIANAEERGAPGGGDTKVDPGEKFAEIFPMLQRYINEQSALACRAVCKDWKDGMDQIFSGNPGPSSSNNNGSKK